MVPVKVRFAKQFPGGHKSERFFGIEDFGACLDAEFLADGFAAGLNVFDARRGNVFRGNEMSARINNQLAGEFDFVASQELRTDFDFDDAFVSSFGDVAQFAQDVFFVAVFQFADVEADFDFLRAIIDGDFGFVAFDVAFFRAGKTDERGDFDFRLIEERSGQLDARAGHTNAVEFLLARFAADFFDIFRGRINAPERQFHDARQVRWLEFCHSEANIKMEACD
jgi:hypothetical protein